MKKYWESIFYMTEAAYCRFVIITIVILGISLYVHTLSFPFVFDDRVYLLRNPVWRGFGYYDDLLNISKFAQLDEMLGIDHDAITTFALRVVAYLTFSLNYFLGGLKPDGYRAVNIVIHIFNSAILYLLLRKLLRILGEKHEVDCFTARLIPTATALIFLVHPLQTESAIYIIQRFTSLAASFYLLSLFLYLSSINCVKHRQAFWLKLASFVTLTVGMLSKETLFTLPLLLLVMELIIRGTPFKLAVKRALPYFLFLPIIPSMIVIIEAAQSNSSISLLDAQHVVNYNNIPALHYFISQLCVITTYLRMILLPYGQNIDPDYPLYTSFFHAEVVLAMIVLLAIISLAMGLFRCEQKTGHGKLILFGTSWFFITIAISSSIIPLPSLMAEHRTYLASIGAILAIICGVDLLRTKLNYGQCKQVMVIGMIIWGSAFYTLAYIRSNIWSSRISLWHDSVSKSPGKWRPAANLGAAYLDKGQNILAAEYLEKAVMLNPPNQGDRLILYRNLLTARTRR